MPVVIGVPAKTVAGQQSVGLKSDVSSNGNSGLLAALERAGARRYLDCRECRARLPTQASR